MPLPFLQDELAFDSVATAIKFLSAHRAAVFHNSNVADDHKLLNCKAVQGSLAEVFEEKYRKATIKGAI